MLSYILLSSSLLRMKKIVSGLLMAVLLTSGLLGCNSKLDVQPVSTIDTSQAFNTSDDVQAAL